jgi:hypothetical protein
MTEAPSGSIEAPEVEASGDVGAVPRHAMPNRHSKPSILRITFDACPSTLLDKRLRAESLDSLYQKHSKFA